MRIQYLAQLNICSKYGGLVIICGIWGLTFQAKKVPHHGKRFLVREKGPSSGKKVPHHAGRETFHSTLLSPTVTWSPIRKPRISSKLTPESCRKTQKGHVNGRKWVATYLRREQTHINGHFLKSRDLFWTSFNPCSYFSRGLLWSQTNWPFIRVLIKFRLIFSHLSGPKMFARQKHQ